MVAPEGGVWVVDGEGGREEALLDGLDSAPLAGDGA